MVLALDILTNGIDVVDDDDEVDDGNQGSISNTYLQSIDMVFTNRFVLALKSRLIHIDGSNCVNLVGTRTPTPSSSVGSKYCASLKYPP